MSDSFGVGEIVWAKVRGYANWPATIKSIVDENKEKKHEVVFFGDNTKAVLPRKSLAKFEEEFKVFSKTKKQKCKIGIAKAAEAYMKKRGKNEAMSEFLDGFYRKKKHFKGRNVGGGGRKEKKEKSGNKEEKKEKKETKEVKETKQIKQTIDIDEKKEDGVECTEKETDDKEEKGEDNKEEEVRDERAVKNSNGKDFIDVDKKEEVKESAEQVKDQKAQSTKPQPKINNNSFLKLKKPKKIDNKFDAELIKKIEGFLKQISGLLFRNESQSYFAEHKEHLRKIFEFLAEYQTSEPIDFLKKFWIGKYTKYINVNADDSDIKEWTQNVLDNLEKQVIESLTVKRNK